MRRRNQTTTTTSTPLLYRDMPPKKKSLSAKKRTNIERQKRFRSKNINIGDQVDRWQAVKEATGATSDSSVAELLINR